MIVAMVAMLMMQVSLDEVVGVVAVRDRLVAAVGTVLVACVVATARVIWRAGARIGLRHRDRVIVDVPLVRMMHVPVVQVVRMPLVRDRRVPATRTVLVIMSLVRVVIVPHNVALSVPLSVGIRIGARNDAPLGRIELRCHLRALARMQVIDVMVLRAALE